MGGGEQSSVPRMSLGWLALGRFPSPRRELPASEELLPVSWLRGCGEDSACAFPEKARGSTAG